MARYTNANPITQLFWCRPVICFCGQSIASFSGFLQHTPRLAKGVRNLGVFSLLVVWAQGFLSLLFKKNATEKQGTNFDVRICVTTEAMKWLDVTVFSHYILSSLTFVSFSRLCSLSLCFWSLCLGRLLSPAIYSEQLLPLKYSFCLLETPILPASISFKEMVQLWWPD